MPDPVIIQVPGYTSVQRQLDVDPPVPVAGGEAGVPVLETNADGNLDAPPRGEVVLSVPSPESLSREPEDVRRVLADAGTGVEPLVVVTRVLPSWSSRAQRRR
jgi:hypothetical protein